MAKDTEPCKGANMFGQIWKKVAALRNTNKGIIIFLSICCNFLISLASKNFGYSKIDTTTGFTIGLLIGFVSFLIIADFELGILMGFLAILSGILGVLLGTFLPKLLILAVATIFVIIIGILGYDLNGWEKIQNKK